MIALDELSVTRAHLFSASDGFIAGSRVIAKSSTGLLSASIYVSTLATDFVSAGEFLPALLDLLPLSVVGYTPIANASGEVVDFAFAYLNPAAQRQLGLPAEPVATYTQQFPAGRVDGSLAFHLAAYQSAEASYAELSYLVGGHDTTYWATGRRLSDKLLVTLAAMADQPRSAVEPALRESSAREAATARTEAEAQQANLQHTLEQAPIAISILAGPHYVVKFANAGMGLLWGWPVAQVVGRPHFEALPDLAGQGFEAIFADVYHTGQPYYLREQLVHIDRNGTGQLVSGYFDIVYQPLRNAQGLITGIICSATEVTDQVWARQQVQAANDELEARVAQHTAETQAALREAQDQREQLREQQSLLRQILGQVPASVATLSGPEHRFSYFNDQYQKLVANRAALGQTVAEALPEVVPQGFVELLDQVYATHQPFVGTDMPAQLYNAATGRPEQRYVEFIYQPLFDGQGQVQGTLAFILDTTERVLARRQADTLQAAMLGAVRRQKKERENVFQLFEQAPAAICLLREPDHRIDYLNPAYQALFPGQRLPGKALAQVQPSAPELVTLFDGVYKTGKAQFAGETAVAVVPPNGGPTTTRYFDFTYQAYYEQEEIAGVSIFGTDVTARVLARRDADQQRHLLTTLFMEAPAPIAILDGPDFVYQLVNPAYQRLFPGRSLLGKTLLAALPELAGTVVPDWLTQVYRTGQTHFAQELPLRMARHDDGPLEDTYFTLIYQARHDSAGLVDGILVYAFEVTDQVLARRSTEANAHQLRLLTDALPVLIGYVDQERRYRFLNRAYSEWFGQPSAELLGRPVREIVGEAAYAVALSYIDRALAGEPVSFDAELPYRTDMVKHVHGDFIPDVQHGQVLGYYVLVSDVTAQVRAQEQVQDLNAALLASNETLRLTNQQLTRTNADLDTFVYTASHDLKVPIANIEGLLDALRRDLPDQPAGSNITRILGMMQQAVTRFQQTIGHLTDIARLQQDDERNAQPVDLVTVITDVQLDLTPLLATTGAQVAVEVGGAPALPLTPKNLRSVVYNLLSNALKYRHPDRAPQVQIRCQRLASQVVLTVQDNGLGLSPEQQRKLFGLFRRLHTQGEGSGVGLYMVKKIVENAGGTVRVQSEAGVGSTFTVALPLLA